jgi:cell division control protein 6
VFSDESKLDINYIPNRLPHREKEYRLLAEFFSSLLKFPERMAQRVIVTGDIGTGKTALCQRFGADITTQAHIRNINMHYIHVNCREYRGKLALIIQHALKILSPKFQQRGYSTEEVMRALLEHLDYENAFMVLA